jgi:hypothetical protein
MNKTVDLVQQRHTKEMAFNGILSDLLRQWRNMHPTTILHRLEMAKELMVQIDSIEAALAVLDNHG